MFLGGSDVSPDDSSSHRRVSAGKHTGPLYARAARLKASSSQVGSYPGAVMEVPGGTDGI